MAKIQEKKIASLETLYPQLFQKNWNILRSVCIAPKKEKTPNKVVDDD